MGRGRNERLVAVLLAGGLGVVVLIAGSVAAAHGSSPGPETAGRLPSTPSEVRVALVTGSTGGLGREVARRLAAQGAHVIVHGRNVERGEALVAEIEAQGRGSARFIAADLASLAEVRSLAETVLADYDRLDLLVNNAGIWLGGERQVSDDGHELHFQVNYLSGFLLTRMLLPLLRESAPARIIQVSSIAQAPIDFDDVMLEEGYDPSRAYAQSKLAQVMFTEDLAAELEGSGVMALSLHPATLMDTDMVVERDIRPRASVEEGTEAVMHLIEASDVESGDYYQGLERTRPHEQADDPAAREELRRLSYRLTGAPGG
jgi:NAD(P)-dependent dehydrogenase (short-subunit alcohol dehydrogenase family)